MTSKPKYDLPYPKDLEVVFAGGSDSWRFLEFYHEDRDFLMFRIHDNGDVFAEFPVRGTKESVVVSLDDLKSYIAEAEDIAKVTFEN